MLVDLADLFRSTPGQYRMLPRVGRYTTAMQRLDPVLHYLLYIAGLILSADSSSVIKYTQNCVMIKKDMIKKM